MQYGDLPLSKDNLYLYMGSNPANDNFTFIDENSRSSSLKDVVNQGDADLLYFWHKASEGSDRKTEAQKKFGQTISHRMHLDSNIQLIGNILFGLKKALVVMNTVRSAGKPVVDDWACLNTLANIRPLNITFLKIEIN